MEMKDTRSGFGAGLTELGRTNPNVVALCADLTGSLKMNDFKDEIECYLGVKQLVEILMKMKFSRDPMENMNSIYKKLASIGMVHSDEVSILNAWLSDLEKLL